MHTWKEYERIRLAGFTDLDPSALVLLRALDWRTAYFFLYGCYFACRFIYLALFECYTTTICTKILNDSLFQHSAMQSVADSARDVGKAVCTNRYHVTWHKGYRC